jgi:single-strand DNA-binding protein
MANGNNVTIVGNLTRDPEMRFTPNGAGQAILGVAVSRRYQDKQGEWQEESGFYNVKCWGTLAENAQSLTKGTRVLVTGRLEWRQWENQQGEKRTTIDIVADEVGPSLRWARVDVHRNERRSPGFDGDSGGGASSSSSAPTATAASGGTGYDDFGEEPF